MSGMGQQASDSQVTPLENAVRLDKASEVIGIMNERVKTVLKELHDVKMQISELSSNQVMSMPDAGGFTDEVSDIVKRYDGTDQSLLDYRSALVDAKQECAIFKEDIEIIKSNVSIEIGFELGEDGKLKYKSVPARAAATTAKLGSVPNHEATMHELRTAESNMEKIKGNIENLQDARKDFRLSLRLLTARIDYATAQLNSNL